MNNDPLQPQNPRPEVPSVPPRPQFTVPSREGVGMRTVPRAPQQAPVQPQVPVQPLAPVVPAVVPQQLQPPQLQPPQTPAAEWSRERTLQPIDEAAVLRERALAEEEVAHATPLPPARVDGEQLSGQNLDLPELPQSETTDVPAEKPDIKAFLPPIEEEVIPEFDPQQNVSIPRRIVAGVTIPIAWMLVVYGINYAVGHAFSAAVKANGTETLLSGSSNWTWVLWAIPYIAAVLVAFLASSILKYGGFKYRMVLSLGITLGFIGLLNSLVESHVLSQYLVTPYAATSVFFNMDSTYLSGFIGRAWATVGVAVFMGLVASFAFTTLLSGLQRKLSGTVTAIIFLVIALLPVAASLGIEKLSESAASRGDAAYTVVERDGKTQIVGAWGLSEGKRLFIGSFYEGYDATAFDCLENAYALNGVTRCFTYCADKIDTQCVEVHFWTGQNTKKIQDLMAQDTCSPSAVLDALSGQAVENILPNRVSKSDPPEACPAVKTPGGQEVRTVSWGKDSAYSDEEKEYLFTKDGMVGYVQVGLPYNLKGEQTLSDARKTADEDALKFIDTFKVFDTWGN